MLPSRQDHEVLGAPTRTVLDERVVGPEHGSLLAAGEAVAAITAVAAEAEAASTLRTLGSRSTLPALVLVDAAALLAAAVCAGAAVEVLQGRGPTASLGTSAFFVPLTVAVMAAYGLYRRARRRLVASTFPDMPHLFHAVVVTTILEMAAVGTLHRALGLAAPGRLYLILAAAAAIVTVPISRLVARWALRPRHRTGSRVLVVGSGVVASHVVSRLGSVDGRSVVGYVDDSSSPAPGLPQLLVPRLGGLADLPGVVARHQIDHVVVAFTIATGAELSGVLRSMANEVQISIVPRLFDLLTVRSRVDDLHGLPVVDVAPAALGPADRFLKRAMDVGVAAVLLALAAAPLLVIAAAVKASSPGPILFRQSRTGRSGRPFTIYKFRSMRQGAEAERGAMAAANEVDGPLFKVKQDHRVTPIGRILRATSLDEFPQLFNVLGGSMSLVGPRPFVTSESQEIEGWAARRFDVRPGMTGLWQTCGRNDLPFEELCRLDWSYVASWSLWWDLRIIWHTPAAVLKQRGAY